MAAGRLPLWVWLLPLSTLVAAVLLWTVWCDGERATWLGGVLIVASGLLVLALVHEQSAPRRGLASGLRRWLVATAAGLAATGVTFLVAGLGYYLRCPPF